MYCWRLLWGGEVVDYKPHMTANKNNVNTIFRIGLYYQRKESLDFRKSFYWLQKATKFDHAEATSRLASLYLSGEDVEYNQ